jgi:hypothetical protein
MEWFPEKIVCFSLVTRWRLNMKPIARTLVHRLVDKGIDLKIIPALIRDTINTLSCNGMSHNLKELTRQIQVLGWYDFELDEYTFQLIIANMETQALAEINGNVNYY